MSAPELAAELRAAAACRLASSVLIKGIVDCHGAFAALSDDGYRRVAKLAKLAEDCTRLAAELDPPSPLLAEGEVATGVDVPAVLRRGAAAISDELPPMAPWFV